MRTRTRPPRWALFVSGRGSNMTAFLDQEDLPVALVVSSRKNAWALQRAKRRGLPVFVMGKGADCWQELLAELKKRRVEAIFLLGFMRIVPLEFLEQFWGPVLNLHPSLLPRHPGLGSIEAAYKAREEVGVTIHRVNEQVDAGEILRQEAAVSAQEAGTLSLQEVEYKVHRKEHQLVRKVAAGWKHYLT